MRQARHLHPAPGHRRPFLQIAGRLPLLVGLVAIAAATGCGSSTTTPPQSFSGYSNTSEGSILVPGVIAVSAVGPGVTLSGAPDEIESAVNSFLSGDNLAQLSVTPFTEDGGASWMPFSGGTVDVGVDFIQVTKGGSNDNSDTDLKAAMNAINTNAGPITSPSPPACSTTGTVNGGPTTCPPTATTGGSSSAITITGAAPDWLLTGGVANKPYPTVTAGSGYIGGSPDGPPTPNANTKVQTNSKQSNPGNCQVITSISATNPTVYVLDTTYAGPDIPAGELVPIAACLCPTAGACPGALEDMASGVPVLEDYDSLSDISDYYTHWKQNTWFESHGLAIAELVHHLAPQAQVVMRAVLNQDGVGDFYTLLSVLLSIWTASYPPSSAANTVINMSLTIEPPPVCLPDILTGGYPQYAEGNQIEPGKCSAQNASSSDATPLLDVIGAMVVQGYHIVAATGNDSGAPDASGTPYGADFPAAVCGVVAAAATTTATGASWKLSANQSLAPFSNEPYLTASMPCLSLPDQLATGSSAEYSPAYALGMNVCSIDDDPTTNSSDPTETGLWSGTSFSTALVSGNLAEALTTSRPGSDTDPYDTLTNLQDASQNQPCSV